MDRIMVLLDDKMLSDLHYPLIVEMWGKRLSGRVKREYMKTFNESERKSLSRLYPKFHKWYLVTGAPKRAYMTPKMIALTKRASVFFGSV